MLTPWAIAALLCGPLASGQTPSATLTGSVHNSSGAPIAAASVCVKSTGTSAARETTTDTAGAFRIPTLPPDTYELTVTKDWFRYAELFALIQRLSGRMVHIDLQGAVTAPGSCNVAATYGRHLLHPTL